MSENQARVPTPPRNDLGVGRKALLDPDLLMGENMLRQLGRAMLALAKRGKVGTSTHRDKKLELVRKLGATEFLGKTPDPKVAEDWLDRTERVLDHMDCKGQERVKYGTWLL